MRIRHLFLLAVMLLSATVSTVARDKKEAAPFQLNGIWQMCFYRSDSPATPGELKTSNSFKILSDDGKFTNMVMMPDGAIIIGSGTYHQVGPNKYVETVEKNLHLPQLVGVDNEIQYEIKGGNIMILKYFVKEDAQGNQIDSWYSETWKLVTMPDSYPQNIIR